MAQVQRVHEEIQQVTLEHLTQLLAALLAHGWGSCKIVVLGSQVHTVEVTPFLKTVTDVKNFTHVLTDTHT